MGTGCVFEAGMGMSEEESRLYRNVIFQSEIILSPDTGI
jgi:hypothetical protein